MSPQLSEWYRKATTNGFEKLWQNSKFENFSIYVILYVSWEAIAWEAIENIKVGSNFTASPTIKEKSPLKKALLKKYEK